MRTRPTLADARRLFDLMRWRDAARVARRVSQTSPDDAPQAAAIYGRSLVRLERHREALAALEFACRESPEDAPSWLARAEAQVATGHAAEAMAALRRADELGAAPRAVEAVRGLVRRARCELPTNGAFAARKAGRATTPGQWQAAVDGLLRAGLAERAHDALAWKPQGTGELITLVLEARVAGARLDADAARQRWRKIVAVKPSLAGDAARAMVRIDDGAAAEDYARQHATGGAGSIELARLALYGGDVAGARTLLPAVRSTGDRLSLEASISMVEGDSGGAAELLERFRRGPSDEVMYIEALRRLGRTEDAWDHVLALDTAVYQEVAAGPLVEFACRAQNGGFGRPEWELAESFAADFPDLTPTTPPGASADASASTSPSDFATDAIDALHGNWGADATRPLPGGGFRTIRITVPIRVRVARLNGALCAVPVEEILRAHDDLEAELGPEPLNETYRGELLLFTGDYAAAQAAFERAREFDPLTRWAYIGGAISQTVQGDPAGALATIDDGSPRFAFLPNSLIARAEALLRLGRLDEAELVYREALEAHPTRVSAWLGLGLLGLQRGSERDAAKALAAIGDIAPTFSAQWGGEFEEVTEQSADLEARLEYALAMLGGNRNSAFVTWHTQDGVFHGEFVRPRADDSEPLTENS